MFDAEGRAYEACVDRWLDDRVHWGQQLEVDSDKIAEVTASLPNEEVIFGGRWTDHFGHFLVETLSRLWILEHFRPGSRRVALFSSWTAEQVFAVPFARELFEAVAYPKNISYALESRCVFRDCWFQRRVCGRRHSGIRVIGKCATISVEYWRRGFHQAMGDQFFSARRS